MNKTWIRATEIAEQLPSNVRWGFSITDIKGDATFNIYAPREAWHALRVLLGLGVFAFRYDARDGSSYEEYTIDGISLSLITPEVTDESAGPRELADACDRAADYDRDSDDYTR